MAHWVLDVFILAVTIFQLKCHPLNFLRVAVGGKYSIQTVKKNLIFVAAVPSFHLDVFLLNGTSMKY